MESIINNGNIHLLKDRLFAQIIRQNDVFYKFQQRGEADLTENQKQSVLSELLATKPTKFLERYYQYISTEFLPLFESDVEPDNVYLEKITQEEKNAKRNARIKERQSRNMRFLAMDKLRQEGYFSNERMREREPVLFDSMVGKYLEDHERFTLRPTVDITLPDETRLSAFTGLLSQFDESQRISDRGREIYSNDGYPSGSGDFTDRFMHHVDYRTTEADNTVEFEMEFDSSDDEGREAERLRQEQCKSRHCAKKDPMVIMKSNKKAQRSVDEEENESCKGAETSLNKFSLMKLSAEINNRESPTKNQAMEEWSSEDDDDTQVTGIPKEQLRDEFVSMMEEKFLSGRDGAFFDYSTLEANECKEYDKMRQQDEEDVYFDAD